MQGKKIYQEKLFSNFQLSSRVPEHNFYRKLKEVLHLDFLYEQTRIYYGSSGQKSIDPVVFFKLCLVGYLENIISDRKLINHASMRMAILYFLGYDIDEELPWHSTICSGCCFRESCLGKTAKEKTSSVPYIEMSTSATTNA